MSILLNFFKIFNFNLSAGNSALSALFGFALGALPLFSPLAWLIILLAFILRLNSAYLALFWLLGELIAWFLHQPISALGDYLLTAALLQELWQTLYNEPVWRLMSFNHTYVMGASILLALLALPLWLLIYMLIKLYQKSLSNTSKGLMSLAIIRSVFGVNVSKKEQQLSFLKRWINVKGMVCLVVVGSIITTGAYFVQMGYAKRLLTQQLTQQWGAPVQIGGVSLGISPFGFALSDVQFTSKQDSAKKALSLGAIKFHMSLYHLMAGKFVVEELQVAKVLMDLDQLSATGNSDETAKNQRPNKEQKESSFLNTSDITSLALPSVDEMLGTELVIHKRRDELNAAGKKARDNAQKLTSSMPSLERLKQHQQKLNALPKEFKDVSAAQQALQEFNQVKAAIDSDTSKVNSALAQVQKDKKALRTIIRKIPQAPTEDWQRINQQYAFNTDGGSNNLMSVLLGDDVAKWIENGQAFYTYAKPYIAKINRQKGEREAATDYFSFGRYISFPEDEPQPDINIKKLTAEAYDESWNMVMTNINFDHPNSQLITTAQLTLDANSDLAKALDITIDYRDTSSSLSQFTLNTKAQRIEHKTLLNNSHLSLILKQAQEQQELDMVIENERLIRGFWQQEYTDIKWDEAKMNQARGNVLRPGVFSKITNFKNRVEIGGELNSPQVNISSNLDNRLTNIFKEAFKQQFEANKRKARDRLEQEATVALGEGREHMVVLSAEEASLKKNKDKWEKGLNTQLAEYEKSLEDTINPKPLKKLLKDQSKAFKDSLFKYLK